MMKRHILPFCLTALLVLSACISNKKQAAPERIAPDLAFFDVKGPVHLLADSTCDRLCEFDKDGTLLTIDGRDPFTEELLREYIEETGAMIEHPRLGRDSLGQISLRGTVESETNYIWNNGRIVSETGVEESVEWANNYEYDADGRLVKCVMRIWSIDEDPEKGETYTSQYTYETFDNYGNWTSRKNGDNVEKRSITYYEDPKQ